MTFRVFILFVLLCQFASQGIAQKTIEDRIESIAGTTDQEIDYSSLLDNISYYREHPIDINSATHDQLSELIILNELQITSLLDYIKQNGKLISIYELQAVRGFDLNTIYNVLPFITVSQEAQLLNISFLQVLKTGKHQVLIRSQKVAQKSKGFLSKDSKNPVYMGSPEKLYFRYRFNFNNLLSWGFTGEKDPGEVFLNNGKVFDFNSGFINLRETKFIKSAVIGDYQLQFGQGLALWSGMAYSKSQDVINIKRYGSGIKAYSAADENLFMRGSATTVRLKSFELTTFYSQKMIDANITAVDSTTGKALEFSSFQLSGLHRSNSENTDRKSVSEQIYGGHVSYNLKNISIGFTGFRTLYSASLSPSFRPYKQFDFNGNENANYAIDYSFAKSNFNFYGESAMSRNGGMATVNGLLVSLDAKLSGSLLYRNYRPKYQAIQAKAFGEGYNSNNEKGLFFGLQSRPNKKWNITTYYDLFAFPWLNYLVDAPSEGKEYLLQVTFTPSKKTELYIRYKNSEKEKNNSDRVGLNYLSDLNQENLRFNISYNILEAFTFRNRVEFVKYKDGASTETGSLISQDVHFKMMRSRISFNFRYAIFDTDTYNSRIYAYENDIMYVYSIPPLFYKGNLFYLNFQYRLNKHIDVWLGYHLIHYENRNSIGTGYDAVGGNKKSEIKIQLRLSL